MLVNAVNQITNVIIDNHNFSNLFLSNKIVRVLSGQTCSFL